MELLIGMGSDLITIILILIPFTDKKLALIQVSEIFDGLFFACGIVFTSYVYVLVSPDHYLKIVILYLFLFIFVYFIFFILLILFLFLFFFILFYFLFYFLFY